MTGPEAEDEAAGITGEAANSDGREAEEEKGHCVRKESSPEALARVGAMQWIASAGDRRTYLERQREIAGQMKVSVRQVQRLIRAWETSGIEGLERKGRSDRGKGRLDEEWTKYIVQTYRAGNRGGRRMSRAQVAVRVAARALEIGDSHAPSRISVYRVLEREIEEQKRRSRVRSIG